MGTARDLGIRENISYNRGDDRELLRSQADRGMEKAPSDIQQSKNRGADSGFEDTPPQKRKGFDNTYKENSYYQQHRGNDDSQYGRGGYVKSGVNSFHGSQNSSMSPRSEECSPNVISDRRQLPAPGLPNRNTSMITNTHAQQPFGMLQVQKQHQGLLQVSTNVNRQMMYQQHTNMQHTGHQMEKLTQERLFHNGESGQRDREVREITQRLPGQLQGQQKESQVPSKHHQQFLPYQDMVHSQEGRSDITHHPHDEHYTSWSGSESEYPPSLSEIPEESSYHA